MTPSIKHSRPTEADGNRDGEVLAWFPATQEWRAMKCSEVALTDRIWKPIDQTPPPTQARRARRKGLVTATLDRGIILLDYLEIRPGDPKDLDALFKAVDNLLSTCGFNRSEAEIEVIAELRKARQGE